MPTLAIVSADDQPVFEATFPQAFTGKHVVVEQLVLHSSLDMVDEKMWETRDMYLRVVDRYNDQSISAYVTPSNYRFLLLHDSRQEDGVKQFFTDLHDLFIKATLNPLYVDSEPIKSTTFKDKIQSGSRDETDRSSYDVYHKLARKAMDEIDRPSSDVVLWS